MPSVRVFVKGTVYLDRLNFAQQDMLKIGQVAVNEIKARVYMGLGPNDTMALPLSPGYAKFKIRQGLKPIRDLLGTGFMWNAQREAAGLRPKKKAIGSYVGHLMENFSPRTVSENSVTLGTSTRAAQAKAMWNQQRQPWLALSPRNLAVVNQAWEQIVMAKAKNIVRQVSGFLKAA